jgi:FlaA1/EpsC-like NDP-sugar epimerase
MRNRYVLAGDLPLIACAVIGAFALRFDWLFFEARPEFLPYLIAALVLKPAVFHLCGLYSRYWRFATISDLLAVVAGVTASSCALALFIVGALALDVFGEFSRAVVVTDWCLSLILIGGFRISIRVAGEGGSWQGRQRSPTVRSILIAGAGQAGAMVVREIARNQQLGLKAIGYLDDDLAKHRKWIYGVQVLGSIDQLPDLATRYRVDEVIIAMPAASGAALRRVAELAAEAGIASKTIPGVFELLGSRSAVRELREIEVADLLRRPQIQGAPETSSYVEGRVVLVTGAGGSIGSELCRQVAFSKPARLVLLGHGENSLFEAKEGLKERFPNVPLDVVVADIRNEARLAAIFTRFRPSVVFHAAAHKHVPMMEDNAVEAVTNNVFGTRNIVNAAIAAGTERLVLISTDKAVAPASVMGATKRLAECLVRRAARRSGRAFVAVRFGNVLGSRGSVIPTFKRQIELGGPVTVTDPEMKRFFMTIPEAVHLVLAAGGLGKGGELFVLEMGEPVRIVDLARDVIRLSGFSPEAMPIRFSGLRPGEKLLEALWEDDALIERTSHDAVMRVVEHDIDDDALGAALARLESAAAGNASDAVQLALVEALPSYAPMVFSRPARTSTDAAPLSP